MSEPVTVAPARDALTLSRQYAGLPPSLFSAASPTPVAKPGLIQLNTELAGALGLDPLRLASNDGLALLVGNRIPEGAVPIAQAYAGHQFGHWVPQLGDGRALLLGELRHRDGGWRDVQLKGAGPTPYSRNGDGRAPIGPVVREYLGSEAMAALGIPTTRTLAAVATGERVWREYPEPGAVLTRVARSHVRIGTFEYCHRRGDLVALRALADHVIARLYPDLREREAPYLKLLETVIRGTAERITQWLQVGFIHGVMNTDNMAVSTETLDYGPFGFLDGFDPATAYSAIDRHGRYAWNQQPSMARWNLARFAETLLPLLDERPEASLEQARAALAGFDTAFSAAAGSGWCRKIGLPGDSGTDSELASGFLDILAAQHADLTLCFRTLGTLLQDDDSRDRNLVALFREPAQIVAWLPGWRARLEAEGIDEETRHAQTQAINPARILRNHLAQWAVDAAREREDFEPLRKLLAALSRPYEDDPEYAEFALPPRPEQRVLRTFCGT